MPPSPILSIIIVNYNVKDYILNCIQSIQERIDAQRTPYEVIVSDNGSADGSVQTIREKFPWVHIIENNANLGFGKANNAGATQARGKVLFFLNPDTLIVTGIEAMCLYLSENKDIGLMGSTVVEQDNRIHVFYKPSIDSVCLQLIYIIPFLGRIHMVMSSMVFKSHVTKGAIFDVRYLYGCAMMFRTDAYASIHGFDEQIFMYLEEFDVCKRLRENNYKIQFYPRAEIIHYGGQSVKQASSYSMIPTMVKSQQLLLKKHFHHSWRIRFLFEAMIELKKLIGISLSTGIDLLRGRKRHAHGELMQWHIHYLKNMLHVLQEGNKE